MIRDPNAINDTEWAARGPETASKPKKISNLVSNQSRLNNVAGVNRQLPTEKPISAQKEKPQLAQSVQKAALSFNGGQSMTAFNTKNTRYGLGKILKRTITGATNVDKLAKGILGKAGSNGKIYRKDVKHALSHLPPNQANNIMRHLGM